LDGAFIGVAIAEAPSRPNDSRSFGLVTPAANILDGINKAVEFKETV
jgi:hypothetical protein